MQCPQCCLGECKTGLARHTLWWHLARPLHSRWGSLQGIIYAYDVTRRETFESVQQTWIQEVDNYSNVDNAVKMIVANKVDRDSEREVSRQEGAAFAKAQGCLFVETSAKANTAVTQARTPLPTTPCRLVIAPHLSCKAFDLSTCVQAFEELVRKILDTPDLLTSSPDSPGKSGNIDVAKGSSGQAASACAC